MRAGLAAAESRLLQQPSSRRTRPALSLSRKQPPPIFQLEILIRGSPWNARREVRPSRLPRRTPLPPARRCDRTSETSSSKRCRRFLTLRTAKPYSFPSTTKLKPSLLDELNEAAIPDDFSLAETREARLKATRSELPLVLNSQVIRLINYFTTGRGKRTFQRTIDRSEAYRPMIERILEEEDVPPEIFHLAQAESGFRPLAISRARATGMWQFMRFTGRQYGLRQNQYVDERYDLERATRAAARHLKDLHLEFGDWYLAMAAYNGGPMRVVRSVKRAGSDYWTLCRRRLLRRETRNYVPIILAMTYVAKNPWLYESLERDPAPPLRYDTITTDSEIHLNLIADITGATTAKLREINPALRTLRHAAPRLRPPSAGRHGGDVRSRNRWYSQGEAAGLETPQGQRKGNPRGHRETVQNQVPLNR